MAAERFRLALALSPATEASFVTLVRIARQRRRSPVTLVVPALDRQATADRVAELVGAGPPVVVEPVTEYLARGHDRAALVARGPALLGRDAAATIEWIRKPVLDAAEGPSPGEVVASLAHFERPAAPSRRVGALVDDGTVLTSTAWGGPLLVPAGDDSVTPDLILTGAYEPGLVRFLEQVLVAGDHAVEVGARIGVFTIRMALLVGPTGGVVAFEPDPHKQELLVRNVALNDVSDWTRLERVAAYSSETDITLDGDGIPYVVDARPLDDMVEPDWAPSIVLIDAGGAERHVLEGMRRTIEGGRLRHLVLASAPGACGPEWESLSSGLDALAGDYGATFAGIAHDGTLRPHGLEDVDAWSRYPRIVVNFGSQ